MIIDATYFSGNKINLPQIGNADGLNNVNQFIDTYEPDYLKKALGYDLWKAFTDGLEGSGDPEQKWADLLDGVDFTYNSKSYRWEGFRNEQRISPIANYVYYRYMEDDASNTTLVGGVASVTDNNIRVNSVAKMISAWNEMVKLNKTLWHYLNVTGDVYPEWSDYGYDWYGWTGYCREREVFHFKNSFDL